jgi:hypothetical protein
MEMNLFSGGIKVDIPLAIAWDFAWGFAWDIKELSTLSLYGIPSRRC